LRVVWGNTACAASKEQALQKGRLELGFQWIRTVRLTVADRSKFLPSQLARLNEVNRNFGQKGCVFLDQGGGLLMCFSELAADPLLLSETPHRFQMHLRHAKLVRLHRHL